MLELGGFAERPEYIDGTEEELIIFNYYVAYDYYCAVLGEDFEALGEELNNYLNWSNMMYDVAHWLSYRDEIEKEELEKLKDGTIITRKNRTFIEACIEYGWSNLGKCLLENNHQNLEKIKKL